MTKKYRAGVEGSKERAGSEEAWGPQTTGSTDNRVHRQRAPETNVQPEQQPWLGSHTHCRNAHGHHHGEHPSGHGRKAPVPDRDNTCQYSPHLAFHRLTLDTFIYMSGKWSQGPQSLEEHGLPRTWMGQVGCGPFNKALQEGPGDAATKVLSR